MSRESEKRAARRRRAREGQAFFQVRVEDADAWRAILSEKGMWHIALTLAAGTERYIWGRCRDYRQEQAKAEWEAAKRIRTGVLVRQEPPQRELANQKQEGDFAGRDGRENAGANA